MYDSHNTYQYHHTARTVKCNPDLVILALICVLFGSLCLLQLNIGLIVSLGLFPVLICIFPYMYDFSFYFLWAAVAQFIERVIHSPKSWQFDPHSMC